MFRGRWGSDRFSTGRPARRKALGRVRCRSAIGVAVLATAAGCVPAEPGEAGDVPEAGTAIGAAYELHGHRGARGLRPENTLPSVEAALDAGVSTVELDLHLSSDGRVVVWHDPKIEPSKCGVDPASSLLVPDPDVVATGSVDLMVSRLTVAELGSYRCDRNPDPTGFPDQTVVVSRLAGDRYGIVELGEIFEFVDAYSREGGLGGRADRVEFNLELKRRPDHPEYIDDNFDGDAPGAFELALLEEIDARDLRDRVVVQSFDHRSLWAVGSVAPEVRLSVLTRRGDPTDFEWWANQGASIWSPDWREVEEATLTAAHGAGLQVIPWTVNDPDLMRRLITMGVDGIITDRPDLAPAGQR